MKKIRGIIDNLFNKLGYYRVDMPHGSSLTEKEILEMFKTYGQTEVFPRFLRDLCANDIRLYFGAQTELERNLVRGAHSRCNYFLALIKKANKNGN